MSYPELGYLAAIGSVLGAVSPEGVQASKASKASKALGHPPWPYYYSTYLGKAGNLDA